MLVCGAAKSFGSVTGSWDLDSVISCLAFRQCVVSSGISALCWVTKGFGQCFVILCSFRQYKTLPDPHTT